MSFEGSSDDSPFLDSLSEQSTENSEPLTKKTAAATRRDTQPNLRTDTSAIAGSKKTRRFRSVEERNPRFSTDDKIPINKTTESDYIQNKNLASDTTDTDEENDSTQRPRKHKKPNSDSDILEPKYFKLVLSKCKQIQKNSQELSTFLNDNLQFDNEETRNDVESFLALCPSTIEHIRCQEQEIKRLRRRRERYKLECNKIKRRRWCQVCCKAGKILTDYTPYFFCSLQCQLKFR